MIWNLLGGKVVEFKFFVAHSALATQPEALFLGVLRTVELEQVWPASPHGRRVEW